MYTTVAAADATDNVDVGDASVTTLGMAAATTSIVHAVGVGTNFEHD